MQCLAKVADGNLDAKMELTEFESGLTIQKCVQTSPMVNQRTMKKEFVQSIFELLNRFCNLVNVGKNFNEDQKIQMSFDLYERFSCEILEDVALFLKKARNGEFGEFYRLDSTVMMKWVDAYMDEKTQAFEDDIRNRENIRRRQENDAVAAHVPDEKSKANLDKLSKMLQGAAERNTGVMKKDNPLFNYEAYCDDLQNNVGKMEDAQLEIMLKNTSQNSHPKVWDILNVETGLRKQLEENKKALKRNKNAVK